MRIVTSLGAAAFATAAASAAAGLVAVPAMAQANGAGGSAGTIYVATYAQEIQVLDEATFDVVDRIATRTGIPIGLSRSRDGSRFYVPDASLEQIEIIDVPGRRSLGSFTLSEGDTKVRITTFEVSPDDSYAILFARAYTRHRDRYEIGPTLMLKYDLELRQVVDTIAPPDGEERDGAGMIFSPDGEILYLLDDDVLLLETEGFTEVDRWEISEPFEPGLGTLGFGFGTSPYEEEGFYTGLFRTTDPVQNRRLMGVARVDLAGRDVDFYTLGPSEPIEFRLAPGRDKAYGLYESIGRYEMLTFDLVGRRIERRQPFAGRPRMSLMPSSDGRLLYIYNAGPTIDVYDAETFEHLRQVELDADMTAFLMVPGSPGG